MPAADLYSGASWYVGRNFRDDFGGSCSLWALSAGFGLVHADDLLVSYSATLSAGHADSVYRPGDWANPTRACRSWWGSLSEWAGPTSGARHRSVESVAAEHSDSAFVVCAGRKYVDAAADDLVGAGDQIAEPERLMVFGSGECPDPRLEDSWIEVPAKIRRSVGGSMTSLSVRAARHVLQTVDKIDLNTRSAKAALAALAQPLEELPRLKRTKLTDDEVLEWITEELSKAPESAKTTVLRRLRDAGFACEQRRFGELFEEAEGIVA